MTDTTALNKYIIEKRRALHRIPELSEKEFVTSEFIYDSLTELGYSPVRIHTGMYVDIASEDGRLSPLTALRCDMDGLPIEEKSDDDFRSKENMHACGHDGHMAIVLGVAKALQKAPPKRPTRLIFQYGEEGEGGADKMIARGVLSGVDEIFAFHLCPELEKGSIASTTGAMFAGTVEFDVQIQGRASHCAGREEGRDALAAAVAFAAQSRDVEKKRKGTLLHIGKLTSGTARNIVASSANLMCTYRYFEREHAQAALSEIAEILKSIDGEFGTASNISVRAVYPPLINSEAAYRRLCSVADVKECKARYTAEDFAFYTEKISGCMAWLGVRDESHVSPLHSDTFGFDDGVLIEGVKIMLALVN